MELLGDTSWCKSGGKTFLTLDHRQAALPYLDACAFQILPEDGKSSFPKRIVYKLKAMGKIPGNKDLPVKKHRTISV